MLTGYIGTYNTASTKGIYQFSYEENSGKISDIQSFLSIDDAKCVDRYENILIITTSKNNKSGIALVDITTKTILDEILLENSSPCFVKHHDDPYDTFFDNVKADIKKDLLRKINETINIDPNSKKYNIN